jgi:hypothetical protein
MIAGAAVILFSAYTGANQLASDKYWCWTSAGVQVEAN